MNRIPPQIYRYLIWLGNSRVRRKVGMVVGVWGDPTPRKGLA